MDIQVDEKCEQLGVLLFASALLAGFTSTYLAQVTVPPAGTVDDSIITLLGFFLLLSTGLNLLAALLFAVIYISVLGFARRTDFDYASERETPIAMFLQFWDFRCDSFWRLATRCFFVGLFALIGSVVTVAFVQFQVAPGTGYVALSAGGLLSVYIAFIVVPKWGISILTSNRRGVHAPLGLPRFVFNSLIEAHEPHPTQSALAQS